MAGVLIAHWAGDGAHALGLCAALGSGDALEVGPGPCPPRELIGSGPLVLLWSALAAAGDADQRFGDLVRRHRGAIVLCQRDDTPLPSNLLALNIPAFSGEHEGRDLARAARHAFSLARSGLRVSEAALAGQGGFAEGFGAGFAGSMAVLGLGGVMAVGASERGPALLEGAGDAAASLITTATAHASILAEHAPSAPDPRFASAALRGDSPEVAARLAAVEALMAERRAETDAVIERLSVLAGDRQARAVETVTAMAEPAPAAPARLAAASLPAEAAAVSPIEAVRPVRTVAMRLTPVQPAPALRTVAITAAPLAVPDIAAPDASLELVRGFSNDHGLFQEASSDVDAHDQELWRPAAENSAPSGRV